MPLADEIFIIKGILLSILLCSVIFLLPVTDCALCNSCSLGELLLGHIPFLQQFKYLIAYGLHIFPPWV